MDMKRRSFLTGGALLTVSGIVPVASGMLASEQAAHDKYKATQVPPPDKLLDSEPLLQVPAPDSVGVSFAVNAPSVHTSMPMERRFMFQLPACHAVSPSATDCQIV